MSTKTVWKYAVEFSPDGTTSIQVPGIGKIVLVGVDPAGALCVWIEVDPNENLEVIQLCVVGTGYPIPDKTIHVYSYVQGPFVWHIYRKI